MAQFREPMLRWLVPFGLVTVVVGVPAVLVFGIHALVDNWVAAVGVLAFIGRGAYEWVFDRENFWTPEGE
jgi:hypothetical protein